MNSRPMGLFHQRRANRDGAGPYAHELAQSLYFTSLKPNPALAPRAALKKINRDPLPADFEFTDPALAGPIVKRRHGDPEASGGFGGSE